MKYIIFTLIILTYMACSKEDGVQTSTEIDNQDEIIQKPTEYNNPNRMIVFCQSSEDDTLRTVEYEYNNGNLISEKRIKYGNVKSEVNYKYDSDNLLISETYLADKRKRVTTYVYNQNNQLINVLYKTINYDNNGQILNVSESEAPCEYIDNQLIKQWEYWGGFNTYEYNNGKVITKTYHTKTGVKQNCTYYKYSGDLLIEEKKESIAGRVYYLKKYIYDTMNRLIQIKDEENIIEENDYDDKKLIEKRTYYYGIDPGYDICYGNYIYRYEY